MNKLWAPWRMGYILEKKKKGCLFCRTIKSKVKKYVILKNKRSFAMLNIYPYNNGHMMIAPNRHVSDIDNLNKEEILDMFVTLKETKSLLDKALKPSGYNIGINTSPDAGAGITDHLHIHIVPRFRGDTNFMPVIYNAKVISQSLDELYKCLRKAK